MFMPRYFRPLLLSMAALLLADPSQGETYFAPPDWGAQPETTFQHWSFNTSDNPLLSEDWRGFAPAVAVISPHYAASGWWAGGEAFGNRTGFWELGPNGTIIIQLPPANYTKVWVEVIFFSDLTLAPNTSVVGATADGSAMVATVEAAGYGLWRAQRTKWIVPNGNVMGSIVIAGHPYAGSVVSDVSVYALASEAPSLVVSNVQIASSSPGSLTVSWVTNLNTLGRVQWRRLGSVAFSSATESVVSTIHSITLTGLAAMSYELIIWNNDSSEEPIYYPDRLPIPGDVDGNCKVDLLDLLFIRNRLGQSSSTGENWRADVNGDGEINVLDLIFVRNRLNGRCP